MNARRNGFWNFSRRVYARKGVADALLALQGSQSVDVNLMLYCAWHASSGRGALDAGRLAELDRAVAPWRRGVIQALREVRERIRRDAELTVLPGAQGARERVLGAELGAEQVAQQLLESLTDVERSRVPAKQRQRDTVAGVHAYFQYLEADLDDDDRGHVRTFLAALG